MRWALLLFAFISSSFSDVIIDPFKFGSNAFSEVQRKSYASTAQAITHTLTFDSNPQQDHLLVVTVVGDFAMPSPPAGWTQAAADVNATGTYIIYKVAGAAESASVVITLGGSGHCAIVGLEYSGTATASPLDQIANANATSASASPGTTGATAQANEICVTVVGINGGTVSVSSWSNSFVERGQPVASGAGGLVRNGTASLRVSATGTQTTTATLSGSSGWDSAIATFKITNP